MDAIKTAIVDEAAAQGITITAEQLSIQAAKASVPAIMGGSAALALLPSYLCLVLLAAVSIIMICL